MKIRKCFIEIHHDNIPGKEDYPVNAPLPRIGEKISMETSRGLTLSTVYDITYSLANKILTIKVSVRK